MRRRRATVATPGEYDTGVRRLAVANGPNIFQMLLVQYSHLTELEETLKHTEVSSLAI